MPQLWLIGQLAASPAAHLLTTKTAIDLVHISFVRLHLSFMFFVIWLFLAVVFANAAPQLQYRIQTESRKPSAFLQRLMNLN